LLISEENPGPGEYEFPTDFGRYAGVKNKNYNGRKNKFAFKSRKKFKKRDHSV